MGQSTAWAAMVRKGFRQSYNFPIKASHSWFPGHMHRGLRQMQRKMADVDCVIEVHDARIPFSGRNPTLADTVGGARPTILILNKHDLFPTEDKRKVQKQMMEQNPNISNVLFTNCNDAKCEETAKILPTISRLVEGPGKSQHRMGMFEKNVLILGIPNVGKSSLINRLRKNHLKIGGRPAAVGARPGWTKAVGEKIRVSDVPLVYLFDTPGISVPFIKDMHSGMRLAACNTLQDHLVGEDYIVDYLLWWLNINYNFSYVEFMGLDQPEDNCQVMLAKAAIQADKFKLVKDMTRGAGKKRVPDIIYMAQQFLKGFRMGEFGPVNLEDRKSVV